MSHKNEQIINTYILNFYDNKIDEKLIHYKFNGKSNKYNDSHIFGELSINLLEKDNDKLGGIEKWEWSVSILLDNLNYNLNGKIEKSSGIQLNLLKIWEQIFDKRKMCIAHNTVDEKNKNKNYEYVIHNKSIINEDEKIELHIFGEDYIWDYSLLDSDKPVESEIEDEDKNEEIESYFPPEIINKTYYLDLYDFVNQRNYISTFRFFENKMTETFYSDNTLSILLKTDEYSIDKFKYNTKNRNLILEELYDERQYIIPNLKQASYNRKLTSLTFNKTFTTMNEYDKYFGMYIPELNAFSNLMIENGWTVDLEEGTAQTGNKLHNINLQGELKGIFPSQIIDKTYYAWVYDNINEQFYLTTYLFKKDKLIEVFYVDQTLTDYVQIYEYPAIDSTFDSSKQELILEISFDSDQYIIPSNNQGRFRKKVKRITFNQDYSTLTEVDRFLDMYAPEIAAFIPLITLLGWAWSEDELWVEFSWLGEEDKFIQTIPEKPVLGQDTLDEASNIQCLNKGLAITIAIQKHNDENVFVFNNVPYALYEYIGFGIGTYTILNVSETHPIGFVINDNTSFEIIGGTEVGIKIIEGKFIMHYKDDVRIRVKKDFGIISYHCYNHGYMGGEKRLKFTNTC